MAETFTKRLFTGIGYTLRGKSVYSLIPTWQDKVPQYVAQTFENYVNEGYKKNELIYTCISYKAESAGQVRLKARKKGGDDVDANHPLQVLLDNPNRQMSGFDFLAACIIYIDLAGIMRWEKVRNGLKQTSTLWPLRPDWLHPIPSSVDYLAGYNYRIPGITQPKPLKVDDVLSARMFDPLNQYAGLAPVQVASRVGNVDNDTTDYIKLFFEEGGAPPGVLTSKQKLSGTDVDRIRAGWRKRYGGRDNWIDPVVLDSEAEYQQIGSSFKDMGFDSLDARSEARICQILKVPPILIGAKIGLDRSTFSNYDEGRRSFWQDTMFSQLKRIAEAIQRELVIPEYGNGYEVYVDYSDVPALQEDRDSRWVRATNAWNANAITRNEFYKEVGLAELGDKGEMYKDGTTPENALQVVEDNRTRAEEQFNAKVNGAGNTDNLVDNAETVNNDNKNPKQEKKKPKGRRALEDQWMRTIESNLRGMRDELGETTE